MGSARFSGSQTPPPANSSAPLNNNDPSRGRQALRNRWQPPISHPFSAFTGSGNIRCACLIEGSLNYFDLLASNTTAPK